MAHYAKLDENNVVLETIVIADRDCLDENGDECEENGRRMCEALTGHARWKKTSYNTREGIYYDPNTGEPSADQSKAFRLNYALPRMKYDDDLDGFVEGIEAKKYPRMIIDPTTGYYKLPRPTTPEPEDLQLDEYPLEEYHEPWFWNEPESKWQKVRYDEYSLYSGKCFMSSVLIDV